MHLSPDQFYDVERWLCELLWSMIEHPPAGVYGDDPAFSTDSGDTRQFSGIHRRRHGLF